MKKSGFVTQTQFDAHIHRPWQVVHGIFPHIKVADWARLTGKSGTYPPSPHTHVKADVTDTPWAWTDVSKTGSNLTDLTTRQHAGLTDVTSDQHHAQAHAASHHTGGGDLLDHGSIPGLGDDDHSQYHNDARGDVRYYTKTLLDAGQLDSRYYTESEIDTKLALQDTLAEMDDCKIISPQDGELIAWDDETEGGKWICTTALPSHTHAGTDITSQVDDAEHWDGHHFADYLDQSVETTASPTLANLTISAGGNLETPKLTIGDYYINFLLANNKVSDSDKVDGLHSGSFSLITHDHDDSYYTETEVDVLLALQDTLADMDDTFIVSPQDGEVLMWDDEAAGGSWVAAAIGATPHATQHEDGGVDEIDFHQIKGFGTYIDQALLTTSSPTFADVYIVDTNTRIAEGSEDTIRVITPIGYVEIGVRTDTYANINTGAARFEFNKPLYYLTNQIWHAGNDGSGSGLDADLWDSYQFADYLNQAVKTASSPTFVGATIPKHFINRAGGVASGLSWYSSGYTAWSEYMAMAGQTSCGPTGNITAPAGMIVTTWALRSFVENTAGYGWTWESGTSTGQPTVKAELRSSDGSLLLDGALYVGGTSYYIGAGAAASKLYTLTINEIYADAGGATDPSYTFTGDQDTGMYQGGANVIALTCGGVERLNLSGSIALFTPSSYLEVKPGGDTYGIIIRDAGSTSWGNLKNVNGITALGDENTTLANMLQISGTAVMVPDHGAAATDMVVNVCYGTGSPPTANTTTIGTIFLKYTA